ncbi:MAG: bifunctional serine/threonine-protein kinase/formylglycine-generating enzyme family protein [Gammaproteobacteria bacterium]|nr:bifunctional serine/threonine-protein kinase/formylglycine-generating enzyme family protein [Gammaproteobacteria bacterium]
MSDNDQSEPASDITVLRDEHSISHRDSGDPPSGDALVPRVLKNRFCLEDKLGSGGMGTVFKAKDLRKVEARDRNPFVAVKVLNNDFREHPEAFNALQREASKSQSLNHPNIVSIFDFDKDGETPFITMELLEGRELAELLRSYPTGLPEEMAWNVIEGICAGLAYAHDEGVIHADFKPGNVYVASTNHPKILDFGIARAVQINQAQGDDTVFDPARLAALTPAYASREMLNGDNPEVRDDLYSLGIVIYLVLTGHHPFGRSSAEDAFHEGLRPEKPKRLSRRQWRVLEKCLAFHRSGRPHSVGEVRHYLFDPAPWRTRPAFAVAATFAFALALGTFYGPKMSEVKAEVRQTTLLDAQVARLTKLIEAPVFDEPWEDLLRAESETLLALDTEDGGVREGIFAKITEIYASRIETVGSFEQARLLYERGILYGELDHARDALITRQYEKVAGVLATYQADGEWLSSLETAFDPLQMAFSDDSRVTNLTLEIAAVLETRVRGEILNGEYPQAAASYAVLEPMLSNQSLKHELSVALSTGKTQYDEALELRNREALDASFMEALSVHLDAACLRLDVDALADLYATRTIDGVGGDTATGERIGRRLGECVQRLAEIDVERSTLLHQSAVLRFGELPGLETVAADPCGMRYLIGNGAQYGRGSYCVDEVGDGDLGPRLVVVPRPDGDGRFAITKQEVTWQHFAAFCQVAGSCASTGDGPLPVTGVSLSDARAYADWLSERTGYVYRLPTLQEWLYAAQGDPDPNRNCLVSAGGVQRGLKPVAADTGKANGYGLLHMLGNVQEWALAEDGLRALGGAYSDPIQNCVQDMARSHEGTPDVLTGFRLVREVS